MHLHSNRINSTLTPKILELVIHSDAMFKSNTRLQNRSTVHDEHAQVVMQARFGAREACRVRSASVARFNVLCKASRLLEKDYIAAHQVHLPYLQIPQTWITRSQNLVKR